MPRTILVISTFEAARNFCTSKTLTYALLNSIDTNDLEKDAAV